MISFEKGLILVLRFFDFGTIVDASYDTPVPPAEYKRDLLGRHSNVTGCGN